ncbi:MAG TPA: FAD-dependent oxidoreductase [Gaiellaceae bacterium]|jgi:NADPH-dependent 2,4-dienoyl-CoA reductase/sulfur reductase-like enzyme|nr:FAD-dependent oxidoreductase [Gaiellaceae bacterium]
MRTTRYLIVGGGLTADAACKGIRDVDADGAITVVAEEPHPPYARPPLSKALWTGDDESTIWRGTADLGVGLRLGRTIAELDLAAHRATDDQGRTYAYERLLLATGGRPRRLPFGEDVIYYRTLDDYRRLRALADAGSRFLVIGGGFIGSEIAAALAMNARAVTMVFPEPGIGARIFPAELSASVTDHYREQGVEVLAGASVTAIERDGDTMRVATGDDRTLEVDAVVAGLGIEPRVELAVDAGLPVADGIVVDDRGRVAGHEQVFAAGDVARFPAAALGGAVRVEHEDHAKSHGRRVGANMAGDDEPYDHLPFFYSDLFDLGYEAVGELDSRLATIADWSEPGREGVVYYLDGEDRPRGVLLWNIFGQVDAARDLIRAGEPVRPGALRDPVG